MKFGVYLSPVSANGERPATVSQRNLDLVADLDRLGYDTAWLDTRHLTSPMAYVAAAAARSRQITLGVVSSMQQPSSLFQQAIVQQAIRLEKITEGRAMLGIDTAFQDTGATMPAKDGATSATRLAATLEALLPLAKDGQAAQPGESYQLDALSTGVPSPALETTVISQVSPISARIAGALGLGLMSRASTTPGGFNALAPSWEIYERSAWENGRDANRQGWSLAAPVHIARTTRQAYRDVRYGLGRWLSRFAETTGTGVPIETTDTKLQFEALVESGFAVIGTRRDAIAQIKRLQQALGGFGCFVQVDHGWTDLAAARLSYELFADGVMPKARDI